ncbi:MAG: hypothetical protein HYU66_28845 [Armatimonadetes bacterium]|nr:hypothetical protein [Armatimonadota bacterium]
MLRPESACSLRLGTFPQAVRHSVWTAPAPLCTEARLPSGLTARRTSDGLVLAGHSTTQPLRGVPFAELTCLAAGPDGSLWVGGPHGAARWIDGVWEVYADHRWLPDNDVRAIVAEPDGGATVHTPAGAVRIAFETLTLAAKAAHYGELTDARHKRFGYVTGCHLQTPGDLSSWRHNIDDNDGLWTAMYVAAESYRYAVTGDPDARAKAAESMRALLFLEAVTPIPGFPARAVTHRSEPGFRRHGDGEWHLGGGGEWEWKADTSSDELDGHYFAWPIYHDLVADEAERAAIQATVRRVTDHLLEHGLYLVDLDSRPTRWGVWAPERLNDDPAWRAERGLNSLEILAYLKVAEHLIGDARYRDAARELIEEHHYALNTLEQKTLTGDFPGAHINHSDDELAFLAYHSLLSLETDPALRTLYLASLERTWQAERIERCPLWNVMYGGLTGRPCDVEAAAQALAEIPLDLVEWRVENAGRTDLRLDPEADRFDRRQVLEPLPWRERPLHKWNGNPFRVEGGHDRGEECGTFWLLPYWMARWYGLLVEGA